MTTDTVIKIEDSEAYWEKHFDYNNWFLCKPYFKLGRTPLQDKSGIQTFGFIEEIRHGENKGKFKGSYPKLMDEDDENDGDSFEIEIPFENLEEAMKYIFSANNPDYGGVPC